MSSDDQVADDRDEPAGRAVQRPHDAVLAEAVAMLSEGAERTVRVRVVIDAEKILNDLIDLDGLYYRSRMHLGELADAVDEQYFTVNASLCWEYRAIGSRPFRGFPVDADRVESSDPTGFVAVDASAPPFDEGRWREDLRAHGLSERDIEGYFREAQRPDGDTVLMFVSRDSRSRARMIGLARERARQEASFIASIEGLERQREREISDYATQLRAAVEELAADLWPHLTLEVHVLDTEVGAIVGTVTPDPMGDALLQAAIDLTALPGSGLRPGEYPTDGRPLADHERKAGRLPHTRLPDVAPSGGPGAAAGAVGGGPGGEL